MNTSRITQEAKRARQVQDAIDRGGFVPLSAASRAANVPLTTLADAVRAGRVPAVRVQPGRWVVRIEAVRLAFGARSAGKPTPTQAQLDRVLAEAGLLAIPEGGFKPVQPFQSIDFDDDGPTLSQLILKERRERERIVSGQ